MIRAARVEHPGCSILGVHAPSCARSWALAETFYRASSALRRVRTSGKVRNDEGVIASTRGRVPRFNNFVSLFVKFVSKNFAKKLKKC